MSNKEQYFTVWDMASGVLSGILTNILYDIMSGSKYIITKGEQGYLCEGISTTNSFVVILIILLVFSVLWYVLAIVLPKLKYRIWTLRYNKPVKYDANHVLLTYTDVRNKLRSIYAKISGVEDGKIIALYAGEFLECVFRLYQVFSQEKADNIYVTKGLFRSSSSLDTIQGHISKYEYFALLDVCSEIIRIFKVYNTETEFAKDLSSAEGYVEELNEAKPKEPQ